MQCSLSTDLFGGLAGALTPRAMAERFQVPYLGALPLDPELMRACEEGKLYDVEAGPVWAVTRCCDGQPCAVGTCFAALIHCRDLWAAQCGANYVCPT